MLRWGDFASARPDLAEAGRVLLYQFGVGLGFLATVRDDGGPRVHPMCPLLTGEGLYAFIVPSPKREDLLRDGRYALHCFPPPDNEDAFYVTGRAVTVKDHAVLGPVREQFLAERSWDRPPPDWDEQQIFELLVMRCLLTRTTGHGDFEPKHEVWVAG